MLKTVSGQLAGTAPWHERTQPTHLNFVLNDIDPELIARNVLLLDMCQTLDPDNEDDMLLLWSVWYNMDITVNHVTRLYKFLDKVRTRDTPQLCAWSYMDEATEDQVKSIWSAWTRKELSYHNLKLQRVHQQQSHITAAEEHASRIFSECLKLRDQLAIKQLQPPSPVPSEEELVWRDYGACRFVLDMSGQTEMTTNPTLMRKDSDLWCVHYASNPLASYIPFGV